MSSHNCSLFKWIKKRRDKEDMFPEHFWERSSSAYGKWDVSQCVGDYWCCQFNVLSFQKTFFFCSERGYIPGLWEVDALGWPGVDRQGEESHKICWKCCTCIPSLGQKNILPGSLCRFGNGALRLGSSSSHSYASFLGRNIIQNFSNVTNSRSQTNLWALESRANQKVLEREWWV